MQAEESPKWMNDAGSDRVFLGMLIVLLGISVTGVFVFIFNQFGVMDPLYSLLVSLPLVGAGLAGILTMIVGFVPLSVICIGTYVGLHFLYRAIYPDPRKQTDEWVFVSSVEIPHDPWQTLIIDLPDEAVLSSLLALEVLLRTPLDLSSPSLLAERAVTDEPVYPDYDEERKSTRTALSQKERFDPRLWAAGDLKGYTDASGNRRRTDYWYDLAPLRYDSLRIDRQAFEQVLDVAGRLSLKTDELPPPDSSRSLGDNEIPPIDASLSAHGRAIDARKYFQMKDARMQLAALEILFVNLGKRHVSFE